MDEVSSLLFKKLINNECSKEEVEEIIALLAINDDKSVFDDLILAQLTQRVNPVDLSEDVRLALNERFKNIVNADYNQPVYPIIRKKSSVLTMMRISAVAAAIMVIFAIALLFNKTSGISQKLIHQTAKDVAPGKDAAVLTLANGRRIILNESANGELAKQAGVRITKAADGKLIYHIDNTNTASASAKASELYNMISTPRGGQYQVNLPDGSQVWLNSASSIKFPMLFTAVGRRSVGLTGEAYFEVAKDKKRPFVVTTDRQSIEVLGTHFDVSSYGDDAFTRTTLLEGKVKITAGVHTSVLKPGQQADVSASISVSNVDTEIAVAWKNGYFHFDDEKLESVMKKISRWYDLDIEYKDASIKNELFAAYSTRFANVSQLLKRMNQVGDMSFELDGRRIVISRKNSRH